MKNENDDDDELSLIIVTDKETAHSKADRLGEYVFKNEDDVVSIYGAECRVVFKEDRYSAEDELEADGFYTFTCDFSDLDFYRINYRKLKPYTPKDSERRKGELDNLWTSMCEERIVERHERTMSMVSSASSALSVIIALNEFDHDDNPDLKITIDDVMEMSWCVQHSCFDSDIGPMGAIHPDGHAIMEGDASNNHRWCY
jgi:hypothetical protein